MGRRLYKVIANNDRLNTRNEAHFDSKEEANIWIDNQKKLGTWGKPELIMQVVKPVPPMEVVEEIIGPLGKVYKVRIPAEYTITIEEVPEIECNLSEIQKILSKTDWLFISDVPLDKEFRVVFKNYRAYLRKLPRTTRIENLEQWLRRTRPEYFMEGRQGPRMVEKFNTYL